MVREIGIAPATGKAELDHSEMRFTRMPRSCTLHRGCSMTRRGSETERPGNVTNPMPEQMLYQAIHRDNGNEHDTYFGRGYDRMGFRIVVDGKSN